MKCILIAFAALLALAAGSSYVPSLYSASTPLAYSNYVASPYAAGYVTPYIASPYTAIQYSAAPVAVAPAIPSGYVAATRGSLHVAPLPEGPLAASYQINTAPAPGTL